MDDFELVQGALAGREEDFEALVERHQRALYAFAFRLLGGDAAAADEVVQAAFVRCYAHLRGFRREASFRTWLFQIALNQCRAARRRRPEVPLDDVPEAQLAVEPAEVGWHRRIEALVGRLPGRQRAVLSLRLFGDLPFRDVARAEGISENNAKVSYHHAIAKLRRWLKEGDS